MTDLVMGGSLLKILNGAPIIRINKINGEEIIKLIPFFIRLNISHSFILIEDKTTWLESVPI